MFIDGLIYVWLSVNSAWMGILSSDSARQFVGPITLFWANAFCITMNAGLLALKMFRSTTFADHQRDKKALADLQTQTQKLATQGNDNDIKKF